MSRCARLINVNHPPMDVAETDSLKFVLERYCWSTAEPEILALLSPPKDPGLSMRMMLEAISYAAESDLRPTIGCLITSGDRIVSRGRRKVSLHPTLPSQVIIEHAEQAALAALQAGAEELVVYSTLEPCLSRGATSYAIANISCTDRLIAAGITRVVIGCIDADDRTRGKGISRLVEHGISVERADPAIDSTLLTLLGDGDFSIR